MKKEVKFYIGLDVHAKFTQYIVRDLKGTILLDGRSTSNPEELYEIIEPYLSPCVIGLETNIEIYPVYEFFKEKSIDIRAGNTVQLRTLIGKIEYHIRSHTESFHSSFKRVYGIITKRRTFTKLTQVTTRIILHNRQRIL